MLLIFDLPNFREGGVAHDCFDQTVLSYGLGVMGFKTSLDGLAIVSANCYLLQITGHLDDFKDGEAALVAGIAAVGTALAFVKVNLAKAPNKLFVDIGQTLDYFFDQSTFSIIRLNLGFTALATASDKLLVDDQIDDLIDSDRVNLPFGQEFDCVC